MTDNVTFNVAQLLKEPIGATRNGEINADLSHLVPEKDQASTPEGSQVQLSGPVRLMHITDGVLVQGDLEASLALPCVRCLEPVNVLLSIQLEETFVPTIDVITGQTVHPEEQDKALWIDEHHLLDLSEVLRQDVLVAIPVHVVCDENCRGLCPTCGKNLNEGDCDCKAEPDPRWAALYDLLKDEP